MNTENTALPPDFDPWMQAIILFNPDGSNITVSVQDFNMFRIYTGRLAINYGTQIGASFLLLLVLLLLTRSEKRKSSIFLINALCLGVNTIRCILLSCYVTSTMWHPYSQMTGNFTRVTRGDLASVITANVFTLFVTVLIMISLSLQVWVVCVTTMPIQRYIIMGAATVIACVATGYKAAFVILSIRQTLNWQTMEPYKYVVSTSYITQAVSIWLFSCIFTYKLGYAIFQRRKLKMPQFGPMQIVFIMGCQTMLIPAIFSCLQFQTAVPELGVQVLTVVCIFLPLSAIWAGVVNETAVAGKGPDSHHRLIQGEFYRSAPTSTYGSCASNTMVEKSGQLSVGTCSTKGKGIESSGTTPSPRKKSMVEFSDDHIHVGHESGFSSGDVADRV